MRKGEEEKKKKGKNLNINLKKKRETPNLGLRNVSATEPLERASLSRNRLRQLTQAGGNRREET